MATNTYVALQTVTASSASAVSFTSIPSTYTDLRIVAVGISSTAGSSVNNWRMTFNGDSTSGLYSNTALYGNGSSAASNRDTNGNFMYLGLVGQASNTAQPVSTFDIMNYSNNTTNKTVLSRGSSASDSTYASVGLWRNTAVINRVDLFMSGATVTGTFTLYGIAAAAVGAKATGGTIYSDSQYIYHAFTSSGTFTPIVNLTADYLVIAGGGGSISGGGGAGGLRSTVGTTGGGGSPETPLSLTASTGYTVTIGAGGTAANSGNGYGATNGSDSVFSTITATGGGKGGRQSVTGTTGSGGSGGGGGRNGPERGTGTTGQGYAGGYGLQTLNYEGGGGGGAGQAGADSGTNGGKGGDGVSITAFSIPTGFGVNGYFAGGGGGTAENGTPGTGGLGGGGNGVNGVGANGTANTGGGAGGGLNYSTYATGGSGGSGLVIVRYAR